MSKIIIGLAGEMASGKGTISGYLEKKYGAKTYRFSDVLRNILKILYVEESRGNISDLSSVVRKTFGEDIISKAAAENIKEIDNEIVILDGARRPDDLKYLKEMPEFKLVFVDTDIDNRYERIIKRGENLDDNAKTPEEFKRDHEREAESQASVLKNMADIIINNNGTIEDLHKQVDEILK